MLAYMLRRLMIAASTVVLISMPVFGLRKRPPGDPAVIEALREQYGLNDPMPAQYSRWAAAAGTGDLIVSKAPMALRLAVMALGFNLLGDGPRDALDPQET